MAKLSKRRTYRAGGKKKPKFTSPKKKKSKSKRLEKQKKKQKKQASVPVLMDVFQTAPKPKKTQRKTKYPGLVGRQPRKNMRYRAFSKVDSQQISSVNGKRSYRRKMKQMKDIDGEIEGITLDQENDKIIIRRLS